MASPPGQKPVTFSESTVRDPIAEQKWAYLTAHDYSPLNILTADASRKAQILAGMAKNDPKAQKAFFGRKPTAADWANLKGGTGQPIPQPTQKAAQGGLMALRGYSSGGSPKATNAPKKDAPKKDAPKKNAPEKQKPPAKPKLAPPPKNETAQQRSERLMAFETAGGKLNKQQKGYVANFAEYADKGYPINPKTGMPTPPKLPSNATKAQREAAMEKFTADTNLNVNDKGKLAPNTGGPNPNISLADSLTQTPVGFDPQSLKSTMAKDGKTVIPPSFMTDPYAGITNPFYRQAIDYQKNMKMPGEYGQASDMYRTAGAGLESLAGYKPQDVSYQNASAERASAEKAAAAQMGSIANVSAERAAAERAQASQMAAIADVNAQQVDLGQYNVNASQMQRPEDVTAKELQRYQMDSANPVTTQALEAYQMAGPGSWTDEGVSSKYMSPYMQGVIDISKREAERDYTKQMNALNAKAVSAGAFGGSRQALERSEAQRNYNEQLQDIQTRGLQQAYESGRSQYTGELSMSQQAALQNLQSKLSTQSQSSQQELQAMLSNQNIDYQTKVQNLQAMLGVQSQEAQQMLNASLANQQAEMVTSQTNAQLAQQAALANQGVNSQGALANQAAALQAALANQQTQFGTGQFNAGAQNQASLANAQLGTQANLANQRAALEAALANQQTQFGVGSLNANLANQTNLQNASLGTQAALQNAQLGTNVNLANSQYGLSAALANQQAGLQGNQQNIAAYGAMGNMATGLGSIGTNIANFNQQQFGNLGAMGNTWQSGMTTAENQRMINEYNSINPATPLGPVWSAIGAAPSGGGGSSSTINRTP